jgi:hypothetical protein
MKKLILTAIIASANLAHAGKQEQVACQLPNLGEVKEVLIETGADYGAGGNRGTLTLLGANGVIEKVNPTTGASGLFNEYNFPNYFTYTNDAMKSQILKFETRQLGPIYIAYVCNRPNAYPCEDRSGNLVSSARVAININGKRILKFNGNELPLCSRRVL